MRPLNRPMFRNGGPIKEGIMNGMKEPQAINTVGSPIFPKAPDGRSKHAIQAAPFLIAAGRALIRPLVKYGRNVFVPASKTGKGGVKMLGSGNMNYSPVKQVFDPNKPVPTSLGKYFMQSPEFAIGKNIVQGTGKFGKPIKAAVKGTLKSPIASGAILYYGGGALLPDGTPDPNDPKNYKPAGEGRQFTGDEAMVGDPRQGLPDTVSKEERQKLLDKVQKDRIEATKKRYYELMGLDKMSKGAIYDSLIGTSKAIQEEGADLKGGLKSGRLQSKIIDAFAKEIDKDKALKRQVDAAILKGEIEKDIASTKPSSYQKAAEEYAAMNNVSVSEAYKALGFDKSGDLIDNINAGIKAGDGTNSTENVFNSVLKTEGIAPNILFDTETMRKIRKEEDYVNDVDLVEKAASAQGLAPGIYIVDKSAIRLDENGKAKALFLG